jgi:histone H3/H4
MSIVVGSKAKAHLKGKGCNCAGDALDGLEAVLMWYLEDGAAKAKANGRKTVRAYDFVADAKGGADVVVGSRCKAVLKEKGCNTAGDAINGLQSLAGHYLDQAAERAKANGRKTVRKHDFVCM